MFYNYLIFSMVALSLHIFQNTCFHDLKRLHLSIKRGSNFDIAFCTFLEKDKDAQGWVWEIPKIETDFNSLCTKNY